MAKKKTPPREEPRAAADYYRLHTQAVEDLVGADASNSPAVSEEELARYRSRRLHFAGWVKALLVKFWFSGAVCFFFFWGLGMYISDLLDQLVVVGIAMGVLTDLLVNNVLRFMAKTPGENDRWMMLLRKGYASGLPGDAVPLGVEPILFGLFYLGFDLLFLSFKRLFLRILEDAKRNIR